MPKIYDLKLKENFDKKIGSFYKQSMDELSRFYEINWIKNTPSIFLVSSRSEYDSLTGKKSDDWVVGNAYVGNSILLLSPVAYVKESSHKYSDRDYLWLIKHELSHLFYNIFTCGNGPIWLIEGTAIYTSGELEYKKKPEELKEFLDDYCEPSQSIYDEAGFVVEALIRTQSKDKFLKLLEKTKDTFDEDSFRTMFKKHYGFSLNIREINTFYKEI
ncbi:hypothetical protein A2382_03375 [Candidatus Woesebacteria bacterium RIFOXYB1_FULL_38_16]|uniref:Peptidase MA-like domain-containing protein n=1 Tax=Candidatus Woesebacteria bacterium RIFOXYB1_FULL_38_16 TaxID=1802538 RepID=A0A1F8CT37_9BACT|nr:MAG: hypothetical protein A2191_02895 [Candidatus Woesebacteria bacterium RIFOXYA1_FULL_38_9]OGM78908.1 MAG: hypothetical protein A2382_03375 [Candidatus Woesebacteria bacterium RIFOXYB1_FULL_38_16]